MRRPSRLLGAPRSQECHAPDLTSGNQECASVGYARTPPTGRRAFCWAEFGFEPVCVGLLLVLAAEEPCPARDRESHRRKVQRAPCSLPSHIVDTIHSDQTPPSPGEPSFLSRASSLNACQVLACPQSCGELSNSEIVPYHRVQTSVRGRSCPQVRSSCTHSFCLHLSSTEL